MDERSPDILIRASTAYVKVVADPDVGGPAAVALVAEARRSGPPEALVAALRAEAWFYRTRLDEARAKRLLDEAARLARRHRLAARLGEVLVTRGAVNHELGRPESAQRDFDRAGELIDAGMAAELAAQQGALHQNRGRLADAARLYRRVLATPGVPAAVRAKIANNLGVIESQRGRPQVALGWLDQAAEAAAGVVPTYAALIAESRAAATVQAGRLTEGLALFAEAARRWEAAGLPLGELHVEQADALVELRLLPEAQEQTRLAVRLLDGEGVPLMAAEAQLRAAQLTLLMGDAAAAAAQAEEVADRFRRQRRGSWAARADVVAADARLRTGASRPGDGAAARRAAATLQRSGMPAAAVQAALVAGRVAAAGGRRKAALAAWEQARTTSRGAPVLVRLRGRVAGALAGRLAGDDAAVLQHSRAGLADLARHRAALASHELRVLASGQGVELGRLGLAALVRSGSPTQVLEWMERTRAAAVSAVEPAPFQAAAAEGEELAAMRAVQAELRAHDLGTGVRSAGTPRAELVARQAELEARIRQESWTRPGGPAGGAPPPRLSTAALRDRLGGQVLVEYDVLDGELIAAVVEPRRTRLVRLGPVAAVRFEISSLLFALRRLAWRPQRGPSTAATLAAARVGLERLAGLLIGSLRLADHAGLVVVPVGELQRVPWAALHGAPVAIAPAAAMWERSARQPAAGGPPVLVAGPDVPGGVREIELLGELYPEAVGAPAAGEHRGRGHRRAGRRRPRPPGLPRPGPGGQPDLLLAAAVRRAAHRARVGVAPGRPAPDRAGRLRVRLRGRVRGERDARLRQLAAGSRQCRAGGERDRGAGLGRGAADGGAAPGGPVGATLAAALHEARATLDGTDPRSFVSWCAFNAFGAA